MREDMFKVIVERPRRGSRMRTREGRIFRASEEVSPKLGMKRGYLDRKWLNENLSPLKRWLESQANRPWDKVYSELCANIDRRNTVQEHIFAHIDNFVERETLLIEGKIYARSRGYNSRVQPIKDSRATLYVHPVTGILLGNRHRVSLVRFKKKREEEARKALAARRRDIGAFEQLHCIEGVWYHVTLAIMAQPVWQNGSGCTQGRWFYPRHWDVVRRQAVSRSPRSRQYGQPEFDLFGKYDVYAAAKRQLSSAELKRYEITNDNAGKSRRCCFWLGVRSPLSLWCHRC
jgi:hypothetical protein